MKILWPSPLVSPPAMWGKIPHQTDFVRHRVGFKEDAQWQAWLLRELGERAFSPQRPARRTGQPRSPWISLDKPPQKPGAGLIPIAFAFPSGALHHGIATQVIGVIARSEDRLGHVHPLIVYQFCSTRWLRQCFERPVSADLETPRGWLYWLSRLTVLYNQRGTEPTLSFHQAVDELWRGFAPRWQQSLGFVRKGPDPMALTQWLQTAGLPKPPEQDAMHMLHGVKHLPWKDWPERIWQGHPKDPLRALARPATREAVKSYWQHDATGGYVAASSRLSELWD